MRVWSTIGVLGVFLALPAQASTAEYTFTSTVGAITAFGDGSCPLSEGDAVYWASTWDLDSATVTYEDDPFFPILEWRGDTTDQVEAGSYAADTTGLVMAEVLDDKDWLRIVSTDPEWGFGAILVVDYAPGALAITPTSGLPDLAGVPPTAARLTMLKNASATGGTVWCQASLDTLDVVAHDTPGQFVDLACADACGGPPGQYVSCVAHAAADARDLGLIATTELGSIVAAAAQQGCE